MPVTTRPLRDDKRAGGESRRFGEMAWALQRPTWQPFGPVTFREIRDRHPKAVPLMYARPYLFAFLAAFGFLGAVFVIALPFALFASLSSSSRRRESPLPGRHEAMMGDETAERSRCVQPPVP